MKLIFLILLLSSGAIAQNYERCTKRQIHNTGKIAKRVCNEHISEFALRSSATCRISKIGKNTCHALCQDVDKKPLADLQVAMNSDCMREFVQYQKMGISYYR